MSDIDPTTETPITIGDRLAWFRGDLVAKIDALSTQLATQHVEMLAAIVALGSASGATEATSQQILAAIGSLQSFPAGYSVKNLLYWIRQAIEPLSAVDSYALRPPTGGCTDYTNGFAQVSGWNEIIVPEYGTTHQFVANWHTAITAPHLLLSSVYVNSVEYPSLSVYDNNTLPCCFYGELSGDIGPLELRWYRKADYVFLGSTGLNTTFYDTGMEIELVAGREYVIVANQSYVTNSPAPQLVVWTKEGTPL